MRVRVRVRAHVLCSRASTSGDAVRSSSSLSAITSGTSTSNHATPGRSSRCGRESMPQPRQSTWRIPASPPQADSTRSSTAKQRRETASIWSRGFGCKARNARARSSCSSPANSDARWSEKAPQPSAVSIARMAATRRHVSASLASRMRGNDVRCAGERGGHSASVSVDASGNMDAARAALATRCDAESPIPSARSLGGPHMLSSKKERRRLSS